MDRGLLYPWPKLMSDESMSCRVEDLIMVTTVQEQRAWSGKAENEYSNGKVGMNVMPEEPKRVAVLAMAGKEKEVRGRWRTGESMGSW